ncbi:MAG: alpha/beta fold hydrolase [Clostridia bacterium]|jgi:pimeloyl-ACP methyl ester carboxylesterase
MSADKEGFRNSEHIGAYIDVKGFQIHYYEEGQGEPLILVHGRGQSMDCWHENVHELAEHFRVILVDMIGWGYSDKPGLEYSIRDYGEFLGAFLDALGIQKTHIGGFAEGGVYVLDFMIRHPERVEKAVLISPGGITRHYPLMDKLFAIQYIGELCTFFVNPSSMWKRLLSTFFDETYVTEDMVDRACRPFRSRETKNVLLSSVRAWDESFVGENISGLDHPILILWGEYDKWHPRKMADRYMDALSNGTFHLIRNCGHFVQEEKPKEFNNRVIGFIKEKPEKEKS